MESDPEVTGSGRYKGLCFPHVDRHLLSLTFGEQLQLERVNESLST
jgi:hypothetical protein